MQWDSQGIPGKIRAELRGNYACEEDEPERYRNFAK